MPEPEDIVPSPTGSISATVSPILAAPSEPLFKLIVCPFIFTSPVTFSAANLMTSIAKDMGIATIIGQDSSGGACSITAISLPDGSAILVSSTGMLTDTAYNSIEYGIRVNLAMADVTSDSEIVSVINSNK